MAFYKWLFERFSGDRKLMAEHLFKLFTNAARDSVVWELLEETGDKTYKSDTFLKAADIVIKKVQRLQ